MNLIPLKLSVTNCFLVKAGDQYVLIDTGYEDDWNLFRTRLKDANVESVSNQSYYSDPSS